MLALPVFPFKMTLAASDAKTHMPSRNFTISFGSAQHWLPSVKQPGLLFFLKTLRRPCKNGRILPATPSAGRGF
ncbi:hypothetical protein HPB47_014040 [Ixodes persulcatus]|uniref:Uncharacterized protein n=1 Tax=Ixodes persulcatus TaxID=34615 RepID=A0AC60QWX3_IXOPE|nr:hypothetical protein HPB47_014040 [Ixodes persulcatus]